MSTEVEVLCRNFPCEFATYINYCRALRFEDRPDYAYLKRMFKDLFARENYQYDFIFDWTILNFGGNSTTSNLSLGETSEQTGEEAKGQVRANDRPRRRNIF